MKAIDTFRSIEYGHGCAQAIAFKYKELYKKDIVSDYKRFGSGRAPEGLCGALFAAMEACPNHATEIKNEFESICGETHCIKIKLENKTSCIKCVDTADLLLGKYIKK